MLNYEGSKVKKPLIWPMCFIFFDLVVKFPRSQKFSQNTSLMKITEDSFLLLLLNFLAHGHEVAEVLLNALLNPMV